MHPAREKYEYEIERIKNTRSMLIHLAQAIEDAPQKRGESFRDEMIAALLHASEIVRDRHINSLHVAQLWDYKIGQPVPDPTDSVVSSDEARDARQSQSGGADCD